MVTTQNFFFISVYPSIHTYIHCLSACLPACLLINNLSIRIFFPTILSFLVFFSLFRYLSFFLSLVASLLSSFVVLAFQSILWPLLLTLSLLFSMFLSCWCDTSHLLFSRAAADATKPAHLSFSTTLRKQQMDVLSSIRNMCRYCVTGSIVVPVYREPTQCVSLLAPISYTRCEEELFAVSASFPRRHSIRVCTMLFSP